MRSLPTLDPYVFIEINCICYCISGQFCLSSIHCEESSWRVSLHPRGGIFKANTECSIPAIGQEGAV